MRSRTSSDLRFRRWRGHAQGRPHRSLWLEQALAREPGKSSPSLAGRLKADACIVGGGFSGLWTAIRLLEEAPGTDVVLLEADICGAGASGRNSGGVGHLWAKLPTLVRLLGEHAALDLIRDNAKAAEDIRLACERYAIDCEFEYGRSAWLATTPGQVGTWNGVLETASRLEVETPYRELSREELRELFGAGPYYGGLLQEGLPHVQPALLARGLRRAAMSLGARIFERSPVTRIDAGSGRIAVHTDDGRVDADQVVLAANAWMAHLREFRGSVMVLSSDIVVTDPIPERLAECGLSHRPGGTNSRMMINYGGVTRDGRVYVGRGGGTLAFNARVGPRFDHSPKQAAEVEADFRYLYPELRDVPVRHSWAGPVDRSPSGLPSFGQLGGDDRIHYAIGFTGHGVSATSEAGHILASAVLRRHDRWSELAALYSRTRHGSFPPEPLRFLGGKLVRGAVARNDAAERDGRKPSRLDLELARLAPATIADIRRDRRSARRAPSPAPNHG